MLSSKVSFCMYNLKEHIKLLLVILIMKRCIVVLFFWEDVLVLIFDVCYFQQVRQIIYKNSDFAKDITNNYFTLNCCRDNLLHDKTYFR